MHTNFHRSGMPKFSVAEWRVLRFAGPDTQRASDDAALDQFTADQNVKFASRSPDSLPGAQNYHRQALLNRIERAHSSGVLGYVIPWYATLKRKWGTDRAFDQAAYSLILKDHPEFRRNRVAAFLCGSPLTQQGLARMERTKSELVQQVKGEVEGSLNEAVSRKGYFQKMAALVSGAPITVDATRKRIQSSLQYSEDKAKKSVERTKKTLTLTPRARELRETEVALRELMSERGIVSHGDRMNTLLKDLRDGRNTDLITLLKTTQKLEPWVREKYVADAHKLAGTYREAYDLTDFSRMAALGGASFKQRMDFLSNEMDDTHARSGVYKVSFQIPGRNTIKASIVKRQAIDGGALIFVKQANAPPGQDPELGVLNTVSKEYTARSGAKSLPRVTVDESSLTLSA